MCSDFFRSLHPVHTVGVVRRLRDLCRDHISENTMGEKLVLVETHVMSKFLAPATRVFLLLAPNYVSQRTLSFFSFPTSSSRSYCSEAPLCGPSLLRCWLLVSALVMQENDIPIG